MFNILMNWEELKSQFDTIFKAKLLKEMSYYKNHLFVEFAIPVVQEFKRLNSLFQQTNA